MRLLPLIRQEAPVLHDELEPLGTGDIVPADPGIACLQAEGAGAPEDDGAELLALENELPEAVASRFG